MSGVGRKLCLLCGFLVLACDIAHGIAFDGNVRTWPGGDVYYSFSNNVSAVEQREFLDAASEWALFANLRFLPRTTQTNYITIAEMPPNPDGSEGGTSSVGMDGGQQFILLSPAAWSRSVICHEIGHALGCVHEQNRSDRDSYIQILSNNVTPGYPGFFVLTNSRNATIYDFHSVMHYGPYSGAIDQTQPTTIPSPAYSQYAPVGRDDPALSFYDRAGMAAIYGSGPALSPVVTNTQDGGVGSLRAALYFACDHPGATVTFNIATNDPGYSNRVFNIQLTDKLPCLVSGTRVDGTSEPGYISGTPLIHLDGSLSTAAGRFGYGLRIRGTNCIVQGLAIDGFQSDGILVDSGARSNLVGGYTSAARNVLAHNGRGNVAISGTNTDNGVMIVKNFTSDNIVAGNFIGLGDSPAGNPTGLNEGVLIADSARSNLIGGEAPGAGNIISSNAGSGVFISGTGTEGNVIQGNYIGINATGSTAQPNGYYGVEIYAPFNSICGNVVSGNGASGVFLSGSGASGNYVTGNCIGLNAAGSAAVPNTAYGVEIMNGATANHIGGANTARNCISGNRNSGVAIHDNGTAANFVQGNTIGLNVAGTAAVPNGGSGVFLGSGAHSNLIGGIAWGAPNIIASNIFYGIELWNPATSNNTLVANSIFGNGVSGISLNDSANCSVAPPMLASAAVTTSTIISASLTGFASTTFQIDFFSSPVSNTQGMTYLGATNVTTGVGGSVSFTAALAGHVAGGRVITATATDPAGNTSGMSGGVAVTAVSSVNDGIPNAWRALYFGGGGATTNGLSCAACDADGTGMNNYQKFIAGLNPTNPASVLRLNPLPSSASNNIASFLSAPGTVYRIQFRDDLADAFWSIAADQVVGTGTNIFIAGPNMISTPKRFYRLEVLW